MNMDVKVLLGLFAALILSACSNAKTSDSVYAQDQACGGQALETRFIVSWEDGHFSVEHAADLETFKKDFVEPNLANIKKFEHDRVVQLDTQPQATASNASNSWGQDLVEAKAVWDAGFTGQGVIVGVVDSVVDYTHVQLASRIAVNTKEIPQNGVDDDGNGYIDDYYGASFISQPGKETTMNEHGTHVTGIITADPSAGPISGLAPGAKFVPAPFITNDGTGNLGDAIKALQYAAARGAKVINTSWGGPSCLTTMRDVFAELGKKGVLISVAAGNSAEDIDVTPTYPASFGLGNQLTVAAATASNLMAYFSNTGYRLVHLAAPGEEILSTVPGNQYKTMSGTSMAAPFVTGAAAVLWSVRPNASVSDIRTALLRSVDADANHQYRVLSHGRLNLRKAYQELLRMLP